MKVIEAYLTPNEYSRPQTKLKEVKFLVVHWVANRNSTAMNNRNFFENRKLGKSGYGSAHDIIDLNGDLIRCLPRDEMGYHVGSTLPYKSGSTQIYCPVVWDKLNNNSNKSLKPFPNVNSLGVECTHIDDLGTMTKETTDTLFQWCVDRCGEFKLTADDIYLHKEIVGWKNCHLFYVNNPNEWTKFKNRVKEALNPLVVKPIEKPVIIASPPKQPLIIPQEDEENMPIKLENWAWTELEQFVTAAFTDKTISSDLWVTKVHDKTITLTEVVQLKVFVDERRRTKSKK